MTLIEAGPDYGPEFAGAWPRELAELSASDVDMSHDWGYTTHHPALGRISIPRARVVGGCSAHNDSIALRNSIAQCDAWTTKWSPMWSDFAIAADRVRDRLHIVVPAARNLLAHRQAFLAAAAELLPFVPDLNRAGAGGCCGVTPLSCAGSRRINTSWAYLDRVRRGGRLALVADLTVEWLELAGDRVVAACGRSENRSVKVTADTYVLACGALGTPELLLRSGIGCANELERAGTRVVVDLPGVGRQLSDHPTVFLRYELGAARANEAQEPAGIDLSFAYALARLTLPEVGGGYAVHIAPVPSPLPEGHAVDIMVQLMTPVARGKVRLVPVGSAVHAQVDHPLASAVADQQNLAAGVEAARRIADRLQQEKWLGRELLPGRSASTRRESATWIARAAVPGDHLSSSCRAATADGHDGVTDAAGRVHGVANLQICDASLFPAVPDANTTLPTAVVADLLAHSFLTRS